jgi:HSP20 family protein
VNRIYFERELDGRQRLVDWLNEPPRQRLHQSSYRPNFDVVETSHGIEVVVDLPGVAADGVQVVFSAGTLVIAGHKHAPGCEKRHTAFHLAERTFGEFTCVLRLAMAIDAGRASASLKAGELRVVLPRIDDRRGGEIRIPIEFVDSSPR